MRITVTSGPGPPGLVRGDGPPTVLVVALPLSPWPPTSTAVISRLRRDEQSPLAGVKTVSLAESVAALAEARAAGADEALLLNTPRRAVRGDDRQRLPGARRRCRDAAAGGGLPGRHHPRARAAARRGRAGAVPARRRRAEEAFLTSSTREVQPLVAVDGQPVGDADPGPVTRRPRRGLTRSSSGTHSACNPGTIIMAVREIEPGGQGRAERASSAGARAGRRPALFIRRPRRGRAQAPSRASPSSRRSGTSRCSQTTGARCRDHEPAVAAAPTTSRRPGGIGWFAAAPESADGGGEGARAPRRTGWGGAA